MAPERFVSDPPITLEIMKLLHTSDWHLGRSLHGLDILDSQHDALRHIVEVAGRERVDAVLISGDVYDRAVPPVPAVALLAETLVELTALCPVIVSSGNHDSAIRLGFGAELFHDRLHIRTRVGRMAEPVVLTDEDGPVLVYAVPFLDPETARHELSDGEPLPRTHEAVMSAALDRIRADVAAREASLGRTLRTVVLAHAFVGKAERAAQRSESERDLSVGGVELVPSAVFAGITYTALGHLHGAQEPRTDEPGYLRYSGSPLRFSFSERHHDKSVTIVELGPDEIKDVVAVPVPQPRPMVELHGPIDELIDGAAEHAEAWVKAVVTDPLRPPHLYARLQSRFPHLLSAVHQPENHVVTTPGVDPGAPTTPLDVLAEFVEQAGREPITDTERQVLGRILEALDREERAA